MASSDDSADDSSTVTWARVGVILTTINHALFYGLVGLIVWLGWKNSTTPAFVVPPCDATPAARSLQHQEKP